jgi:hemerythrin-like domain-containing protein
MEAAVMGLSERVREPGALTPAAADALALLESEHRAIAELFEKFEGADLMRKAWIVERICSALKLHAQIEEEIFYPAARAALAKYDEVIEETDVEHASIKVLVRRIEESGPADEYYETLVRVLGDYVKHHVAEEERELFSRLRGMDIDLLTIGAELARRRAELTHRR